MARLSARRPPWLLLEVVARQVLVFFVDIYQARRVQRIRAFLPPKKVLHQKPFTPAGPEPCCFWWNLCHHKHRAPVTEPKKMPKYPDSLLSTTVQWSIRHIYLHASQQLPTIPRHVFAITKQDASHTASRRKEPSQSYRTLRCKGLAMQLRPCDLQMLHIKDHNQICTLWETYLHTVTSAAAKRMGGCFSCHLCHYESQIGTNRFANSADFDSTSTLSTQQGTKQGHTAMCPDLRRLVGNGLELI